MPVLTAVEGHGKKKWFCQGRISGVKKKFNQTKREVGKKDQSQRPVEKLKRGKTPVGFSALKEALDISL